MHDYFGLNSNEYSSPITNCNLNFATAAEFSRPNDNRSVSSIENEDSKDSAKKSLSRDPLSHRIIEKRRRDRMNNCLADLSRLLPTSFLKKSRGRIEKTEIIEMAIKHVQHLESLLASPHSFTSGYKEATSEVIRFLFEYRDLPGDQLYHSLLEHLRKHLLKLENNSLRDNINTRLDNSLNTFKPWDNMNNNRAENHMSSPSPSSLSSSPTNNGNNQLNNNIIKSSRSSPDYVSFKKEIKQRFIQEERKYTPLLNDNNSFKLIGSPERLSSCPSITSSLSSTQDVYSSSQINTEIIRNIPSKMQLDNDIDKSDLSFDGSADLCKKCQLKDMVISNASNIGSGKRYAAFVLEPNGSYYIPCTVDESNIPKVYSTNILHSVSIAVNFDIIHK